MSGKNLVLQLWAKMLSTNQVAVLFDHQYLWKESIDTFDFFARNSSSSEVTIWDYYFWLGVASSAHPRAPPPVPMSSSIAGFIDYQYLRKESLDVVVFLDGDSYPGKIASETAFFGWVWPGALLIQSDRRILWLSMSLDGINWYLRFFTFR